MKCNCCRWWTHDPEFTGLLSWYCLLWWFVRKYVVDIRDCCYWEERDED